MKRPMQSVQQTIEHISAAMDRIPISDQRHLIAIAGPPASGKSTIATALCVHRTQMGKPTGLIAMDGFHLDNPILDARGLRDRKGAPETFDLAGFTAILDRALLGGEIIAPSFDRERDVSIGSSVAITPETHTIIVEGNYLLLDEPGWQDLTNKWTLSIMLRPSLEVIRSRLTNRWLDLGYSMQNATNWIETNDIPNAKRVLSAQLSADLMIG